MLSIVKDIFGEDAYKVSLMNDVEVIAQTNNNGYSCIRENVGYTALSFFKYLKISEDFSETLDSLVTKNVVFMNDGQTMCAYILTEEGQINSCVSIYKNEDHFIMEIYSWDYEKVKEVLKEAECELTEIDLNCVLIEGPNSRQILLDVFDVDLEYISYQNHEYFDCNGDELLIARTGYTGEFGYKVLDVPQYQETTLSNKFMFDAFEGIVPMDYECEESFSGSAQRMFNTSNLFGASADTHSVKGSNKGSGALNIPSFMKKSRVISPKYEEALRWDAKNHETTELLDEKINEYYEKFIKQEEKSIFNSFKIALN